MCKGRLNNLYEKSKTNRFLFTALLLLQLFLAGIFNWKTQAPALP